MSFCGVRRVDSKVNIENNMQGAVVRENSSTIL